MKNANKLRVFMGLLIAFVAGVHAADPPNFGPKKEVLSINTDQYVVSLEKKGNFDLRDPAGGHFFDDVTPLVRIVGEDKDRVLRTRWQECGRSMISDALGEGQGLIFAGEDFEWHVHTYPSKPYLSATLVFINKGKDPVQVARLTPWSVGYEKRGGVSLGVNTAEAWILDNGHLFRGFDDYASVSKGSAFGNWNLAAYNPASGRSLIAGFVSNLRAYTEFELRKPEQGGADALASFRADCVYDAPVTLAPGEKLKSETVYLAVTESDPLLGLERFAMGEALWNNKRNTPPFIPHGWDSWSAKYHTDINEASMLAELDAEATKLKRYGWSHFALDAGWERMKGDWEANPEKFPHGMKFIADEIHKRGMTASLWIDPFTVDKNAPIAKEHPEWLVKPGGAGLMIVGDKLILDPTAPGAEDYIRGLARKICGEWGFDGLVEADFVYHLLLAEGYHDKSVTKIEAFRKGMLALKEGAGEGKFIMSMTPQPVNGAIVNGIRTGHDCDPVWRGGGHMGNWGAVDTLSDAVRKWYLASHLYIADQDCVFFDHDSVRKRWNLGDKPGLTWEQSVAWATGAAMTGGAVKIGLPFSELNEKEVDVLRRLLPSPGRAARPVDVFQQGEPRVWHLPLKNDAGAWDIVGVFNWDDKAEAVISVPFASLALGTSTYYTVYDFWPQQYLGTAKGQLEVRVPPGGVRLLGLRRLETTPMLIATDRHYTQGALDHSAVTWDPSTRRLTGQFTAVENTPYAITVSVPEGFSAQGASWSGGAVNFTPAKTSAVLRFTTTAPGPAAWTVQY